MKKLTSFILVAVILLSTVLSGCGGEAVKKVRLFTEDGTSEFIIIRPAKSTPFEIEISSKLRSTIKDAMGIEVSFRPDTMAQKKGQLEVNIGVTNRPAAKETYDSIIKAHANNGMDFSIRYKDNVVYIIGASDDALSIAVNYFIENFCFKNFQIDSNYYLKYHYENKANDFTIFGKKDLSNYKIVTPEYNMSWLIGREILSLKEQVKYATGTELKEIPDDEKATDYEIVISNAKRDGVPEITDADEYRITVKGKKIYVNGGSNEACAMAVKELTAMAKDGKPINKKTNITGSYTETAKKYTDNYSITLEDNFDTFNREIWTSLSGLTTHYGAGNADKPVYMTDENISIKDGNLSMVPATDGKNYYAAEIRTNNYLWYKYGFIEISAKWDVYKGICNAFWLLGFEGQDHHGEFDIFECFGDPTRIKATSLSWVADNITEYKSGVHYCGAVKDPSVGGTGETYYILEDGDTFTDCYHTIGFEWDENGFRWVYDGREFLYVNSTADERGKKSYNDFVQILLTCYSGVDINETDYPDETTDWDKAEFLIDWLKLYQLPGQEVMYR